MRLILPVDAATLLSLMGDPGLRAPVRGRTRNRFTLAETSWSVFVAVETPLRRVIAFELELLDETDTELVTGRRNLLRTEI